MKTALNEFIEYLEGIKVQRDNIPIYVITTAKNYLQAEKQQIIDAYAQGFIESEIMDKGAEQYYNETFEK
jgi:hypothetical protein